jgi:very-short-patch-repair endonuclease
MYFVSLTNIGLAFMTRKIPLRCEGVPGGRGSKILTIQHLPYNPALKKRARELRHSGNLAEVLFWNAVKHKKLNGLDFDRQRIIGSYIVDFYCHSKQLVIEIDGASHNTNQDYDFVRDQYLRALGLEVIRISDQKIKTALTSVLTWISDL